MSFTRYFRGRYFNIPGSYSAIDDSGGQVQPPAGAIFPLLIGPATAGTPSIVMKLQSPQEAVERLKGGDLLTAVLRAFNTQQTNDADNVPYWVYAIRVGTPTQSVLNLTDTNPGVSEVQTATLTNATAGTFTMTFNGQSTIATAYNATAATLQTNLQSLSTIGTSNATVAGSAGGPYTITFAGTLTPGPQNLITASAAGLTGIAAVNEVQSLVATSASAGTFTMTFGGQTTTPIAYNASAATVQAALQALSTIGAGNMTCAAGPLPTTPVTLTFAGTLAGAPQALITTTSTGLTGGTAVVTRTTAGVTAAAATIGVVESTLGVIANPTAITLTSVDYGFYINGIRATIANGTLGGYKITVSKDADAALAAFTQTTDNLTRPGIALYYTGSGTACNLTVNATSLTTTVTGATADNQNLPFTTYPTLQAVVDRLNATGKYIAVLADDYGLRVSTQHDWIVTPVNIIGGITLNYTGTGSAASANVAVTSNGVILTTTCTGAASDNLSIPFNSGLYTNLDAFAKAITGATASTGSPDHTWTGAKYTVVVKSAFQGLPVENINLGTYADIKTAPINLSCQFTTAQNMQRAVDYFNEFFGVIMTATRATGSGAYPLTSVGPAYFTGGTDGVTTPISGTAWTNALTLAQTVDAQVLSVVTPEPDIHAQLATHCSLMSDPTNRRERVGIVGGDIGEVMVEAQSRSQFLGTSPNGEYIQLVWPGITDVDYQGNPITIQPYILAAQMAGLTCGLGVGLSKTNRFIKATGVEVNLTRQNISDLISSKVTCIENVTIGPTTGFRVSKDITTFRGTPNFIKHLFATKLTSLMLSKLVREALEPLVGLPNDRNWELKARNRVETTLDAAIYRGWIVAGANTPAYNNIVIRRDTDTVNVDFDATVVTEVDFIFTTLHLTVYRKGM